MGGCHNSNNKNQEETCIIIFYFLSKANFDNLKKKLQGFYDISNDQIMIFSCLKINQSKIFVSNGEILKSKEEYDLYLQSCNLEGEIKQIVAMIDSTNKSKFIQTSFYKYVSAIQDSKDFTTFLILEDNYEKDEYKKILMKILTTMEMYLESKLLGLLNFKSGIRRQLDFLVPEIINHDIVIENYSQYLEQQYKNLSFRNQSAKEIDSNYQMLIQTRNKSLYDCSSQIDENTSIHYKAISLKFNLKILDYINDFTNAILNKIGSLQRKFKESLVCCNICKSIYYHQEGDQKKEIISQFYNSFQNICVKCQFPKKYDENVINYKYSFKFQLLNISPIQTKLESIISTVQQNSIIQTPPQKQNNKMHKLNQGIVDNFQGNIKENENQEKRIILIGKSGVGKSIIFNKLCSQQQQYKYKSNELKVNDQICKNNLYYVMNTPAFELKSEEGFLDQQQIEYFGKIIGSTKINQIFIVTNYDRIETMYKKIMECFKFLNKFSSKISIIIMNFNKQISETNLQNDLLELQEIIQVQNWLHFNEHDEENIYIEQITKLVESTHDSFLNTKDTFFDRTQAKLTESQFGQSLQNMKYQKQITQIQEEIQKIQERKAQKLVMKKSYQIKISENNKQLENLFQQLDSIQMQINSNLQSQKDIAQEEIKVSQEIVDLECSIYEINSEISVIEKKMR